MKEKSDVTKLEFLLTLNDNIVVQRYFNVREYNSKARASLDLYNLVRSLSENIQKDLKTKALNYLNDNAEQIFFKS